jgi:hypothetical protein
MEHIETERVQLGENLEEMESRIKDAADPRVWYERNPGLILGAAAASGLVLGLLCTSRSSDSSEMVDPTGFSEPRPRPERHFTESRHMKTVKNTLDTTIAALVGLGARKFQDFVSDNLPGFQEQYHVASQRQAAWDAADSKFPTNP